MISILTHYRFIGYFKVFFCIFILYYKSVGQDQEQLLFGLRGGCCCGNPQEFLFLGFEDAPQPPPGSFIPLFSGGMHGPWIVSGAVDIVDGAYNMLGAGNPNGASTFVDMHGSPGFGTISTSISGFTPGNNYTIELWYAHNASFNSTLRINLGSNWVVASWPVNNIGSGAWLKKSFMFQATSSSAVLEFSSTGPNQLAGPLIDDIKIFECPVDQTAPVLSEFPPNLTVGCGFEVGNPPMITATDNCDANVVVQFKKSVVEINPCYKEINYEWTATDQCQNTAVHTQNILIRDIENPYFISLPQNEIINCKTQNIYKRYSDWIQSHAGAKAEDNCIELNWDVEEYNFKSGPCDSNRVNFIVTDACGNSVSEEAYFIIHDTVAPQLINAGADLILNCDPDTAMLNYWLSKFANILWQDDCGIKKQNYIKLKTANDTTIFRFYVEDQCKNIDSVDRLLILKTGNIILRDSLYSCNFSSFKLDSSLVKGQSNCDTLKFSYQFPLPKDTSWIQGICCTPDSAKTYTQILSNRFGCDSLIFLQFSYKAPEVERIKKPDCLNRSYSDTVLVSTAPCGKYIITEYFPAASADSYILRTSCDSSQAGITKSIYTNQYGCDSILYTITSYAKQQIQTDEQYICDLQKEYSDTTKLISSAGCDSFYIKQYKRASSYSSKTISHSCSPQDTGTIVKNYTTVYGCDSILVLQTKLAQSYIIDFTSPTCDSGLWNKTIEKHFQTQEFGCDSIIRTFYSVALLDTIRIFNTSCDILTDKIDTALIQGIPCDTIAITLTKSIPKSFTKIDSVTCNPNHIGFGTLLLKNQYNCDSIIDYTIKWKPIDLDFKIKDILCVGDQAAILLDSSIIQNSTILLNNNKISLTDLNSLNPGNYTIKIIDQNNCESEIHQFNIQQARELNVSLGSDRVGKANVPVPLEAKTNRLVKSYRWETSKGILSCDSCKLNSWIGIDSAFVTVTTEDENGCLAEHSIWIKIQREGDFYYPNIFSPNGDNINDRFYVHGDPFATIELMNIYDRWGELVFSIQNVPVNHEPSGWDGNFKSEKCLPGVYVFFAQIKTSTGDIKNITGDVTLIR